MVTSAAFAAKVPHEARDRLTHLHLADCADPCQLLPAEAVRFKLLPEEAVSIETPLRSVNLAAFSFRGPKKSVVPSSLLQRTSNIRIPGRLP